MKLPLLVKEEDMEKEEDDKRSRHRENPYFMKNRKADDVREDVKNYFADFVR